MESKYHLLLSFDLESFGFHLFVHMMQLCARLTAMHYPGALSRLRDSKLGSHIPFPWRNDLLLDLDFGAIDGANIYH